MRVETENLRLPYKTRSRKLPLPWLYPYCQISTAVDSYELECRKPIHTSSFQDRHLRVVPHYPYSDPVSDRNVDPRTFHEELLVSIFDRAEDADYLFVDDYNIGQGQEEHIFSAGLLAELDEVLQTHDSFPSPPLLPEEDHMFSPPKQANRLDPYASTKTKFNRDILDGPTREEKGPTASGSLISCCSVQQESSPL